MKKAGTMSAITHNTMDWNDTSLPYRPPATNASRDNRG